jgi:DHA1 family bicyclomycin/chloramphenicol resistance-like MFS transporter
VVCPASDRFGRRPVLLVGLLAFSFAGMGCALARDIDTLIAFRFVQGIAACVGPVLGRAVVRDRTSAARAAEMLSTLIVVLAIAPLVAPMLGGALLRWFGWPAIFWTLGVTGLLLFGLVALFLEESLSRRDPEALRPVRLARNIGAFLAHRACLTHALIILFVFGAQFSYISNSPFVVIEVFGVAPDRYGFFFGATAACIMAGAALNTRLLRRHPPARLLSAGMLVLAGAGGVLALVAIAGSGVFVLFAPLLVFFFALGFVTPNAIAAALEPMPHMAGVASSVVGAFQMIGGATAGWVVSVLYDRSPRPMAFMVASLGAAGLAVHRGLLRQPRRQSETPV